MKTSLIVGMGIGQLYASVLSNLGHTVITVDQDPNKKANFETVDAAIVAHRMFDTVHICTPNFTHFQIASKVAPYTKIVFVEKPGVADKEAWQSLVEAFKYTRFMMVKNNQWRNNFAEVKEMSDRAKTIHLKWLNTDRVPNPGSWFTTKKLAFGGVSRDLMPHLLSWMTKLDSNYKHATRELQTHHQRWKLEDLLSTDYGTVNPEGTYDVDDFYYLEYKNNNKRWLLTTSWRTLSPEQIHIQFIYPDDTYDIVELGLCPEDAYQNMIQDAIDNINNHDFWLDQLEQDLWIHEHIKI
jgi:predicted dehydrogenase